MRNITIKNRNMGIEEPIPTSDFIDCPEKPFFNRTLNGLNNLRRFMLECYSDRGKLPKFDILIKKLPKDSLVKQSITSSRFNRNETVLYKYINKKYSDDLIIHNLLFCDTIKNCREGTWGDPFETVFYDMMDLFYSNNKNLCDVNDELLRQINIYRESIETLFNKTIDALGEKRICCMSKTPYIKEMWKWKGNEDALCVPINVTGLDFYKIEYTDSKIDFSPYAYKMYNLILDAMEGKVSRNQVKILYNEFLALTYLSLCKKKIMKDDDIRWDVQQEYRMFPEDLLSYKGMESCFIDLNGRVGKPITYEDFQRHEESCRI